MEKQGKSIEIYRNSLKKRVYRKSIEYSEEELKVISKSEDQKRVAVLVEDLYKKFGHEESLDFYRWWAWRLVKGEVSEDEYHTTIELSLRRFIKNNHNYFIRCLSNKKAHLS